MKRIAGLILASFIGGIIAISSYVFFNKKNNITEKTQDTPVIQNVVSSGLNSMRYSQNPDFVDAAEKTVHAVVHVKVRSQISYDNAFYNFLFGRPDYNEKQPPVVSSGSGVIISNDGYIVTNNHVVEGADILEVTLNDKRTFTAKVIGSDPTTDIALIKIDGKDFPYIPWGNSDDLKVGEWVLAVGNPFNLASTVTAGIVSAKARSINIINKRTAIEAFIQTDAAVNPGNSGGALVNTSGELIGINTAIASPTGAFSGYSFAVPQKIAQKIVNDLLEYGAVQRAFIGVSITDVTSEVAKKYGITGNKGVFVNNVTEGGAAQKAGIKTGDIILKVKGVEVNSTPELQEQIGQYRPGDQITITILRGNKEKNLLVTLRNINGEVKMVKANEFIEIYGAKIKNLSSSKAAKLRIKGGVEVVSLTQGKFKSAGIKEGFIITGVNQQRVYDIQDMKALLQNVKNGGIYIEGIYPNGIEAYYAFGI